MIDPLFDEDYNLGVMIHQTDNVLIQARQNEISQHGLSFMEAAVLFTVQVIERTSDRKATIAEISRWFFRSQNSMSELISRMEKKGLISKVRDLAIKTAVRVELTEKGKQAYQMVAQAQVVREIMSSLSEEERHHLWIALGKIRHRGLKAIGIGNKPPFPQFL